MCRATTSSMICFVVCAGIAFGAGDKNADGWTVLFPADGVPEGWRVTHWADVSKPAPNGAAWEVKDGVLHGSTPRGSWLMSEREYDDFSLQFEFKLGPQGNSGVGLRFPNAGDPAFDGLELQIVDRRYYGDDKVGPEGLTGAIYNAVVPSKQAYKPEEWNSYEISCIGNKVSVKLNGELIQDVDLDKEIKQLERGEPLAKRPRRGRIGFQELSRGGTHVQIRNARIKELDAAP